MILKYRNLPFENRYKITEEGHIISTKWNKKLKPFPDGRRGYLKVKLYYGSNTKKVTVSVHRLMMENFYPLSNSEKMEVDHINKIVTDNRIENLRWVTREENYKHKDPFFTHRNNIKYYYMHALRLYYTFGYSVNRISKALKIDPQCLSDLIKGRRNIKLKDKWLKTNNKKESKWKVQRLGFFDKE